MLRTGSLRTTDKARKRMRTIGSDWVSGGRYHTNPKRQRGRTGSLADASGWCGSSCRWSCMRRIVASLAALLLAGGSLRAADGPPNAKYGQKIDHVTFKDAAGKSASLPELARDK